MRLFLLLIAFLFVTDNFAQAKQAFVIYNQDGEKVSYADLLNASSTSDILLFGEAHNSAMVHWLEYELVTDLFVKEKDLGIGMEMFSADQQASINNYLADNINYKQLQNEVDLWPNFQTDYLQILDFAKDNELMLIGTNAPQQIASNVYKKGGFSYLDKLSEKELEFLPPRPIPFDPDLPAYKKMKKMMGVHANDDIVKAQALKDATMAYHLTDLAKENELVVHINGKYHSDDYEGIFWYLQQYRPELKVQTISMVNQADIFTLQEEHQDTADFIICIDKNMTKTY
jgi:uncharacterized iron-regulated protein